jgi:Alternative complex III, ActD subunit
VSPSAEHAAESTPRVFGLAAEFRTSEETAGAAREVLQGGFRDWDIYCPTPIEELIELVPTRRGRYVTVIMVVAGLIGACVGYYYQYWDAVLGYPINVGGRPLNAWVGFVPVSWEIGALFTVYAGFFAFFYFCRLSRLYHPIFDAPDFERASQDRFFICVERRDRGYDPERLGAIFARHGALRIEEVPEAEGNG